MKSWTCAWFFSRRSVLHRVHELEIGHAIPVVLRPHRLRVVVGQLEQMGADRLAETIVRFLLRVGAVQPHDQDRLDRVEPGPNPLAVEQGEVGADEVDGLLPA